MKNIFAGTKNILKCVLYVINVGYIIGISYCLYCVSLYYTGLCKLISSFRLNQLSLLLQRTSLVRFPPFCFQLVYIAQHSQNFHLIVIAMPDFSRLWTSRCLSRILLSVCRYISFLNIHGLFRTLSPLVYIGFNLPCQMLVIEGIYLVTGAGSFGV